MQRHGRHALLEQPPAQLLGVVHLGQLALKPEMTWKIIPEMTYKMQEMQS
jgi:hypothetical protein